MGKTKIRPDQIRQILESDLGELIAQGIIGAQYLKTNATDAELNFLSGVTSAIQTQLNSKLPKTNVKNVASVDWSSDVYAATAKAIAAKITAEISAAQIGGVMAFKGKWSTAPSTSAQGYTYVYDSGTAPTGITLEVGDMLVAAVANASKSNASHWTVVQSNLSGAVTAAETLTNSVLLVGGGGKTAKKLSLSGLLAVDNGVPRQATEADLPSHNVLKVKVGTTTDTMKNGDTLAFSSSGVGSLTYSNGVLTIKFPSVSGGNAEAGKYISGATVSNGTISFTKASLPSISEEVSALYKAGVALSGTKDGVNKVFTLPENVVASTVSIMLNGVQLTNTVDYTLSGTGNKTVTFAADGFTPDTTDSLTANYVRM